MPFTAEVIERLARHYFLTPTHVQQAAQLFDSYTQDDATTSDAETRISVKRLQQLLVALGDPLSQQDVVEILHLFSTSAATAIPSSSAALSPAAAATTATAAASAAPPAAAAAGTASRGVATASSRKGNTGNRSNVAPAATAAAAVAGAPNQPSSRRTTSAPPTTATDGAGHASSPSGDLPSSASTLLTFTTRPITSADHATDEERHLHLHNHNNSSLSASAVAVQTSAVNLHGMTFPAFVYFLLVYPTLVHHIFRHSSSTSAGPTTTAFTAVNVAELFSLLDSDGDGVCSAQDVRRVAERCATDYDGLLIDDPDLCRLAEMHPVELEEAIREFDMDGDGVVTLADLQQALQY